MHIERIWIFALACALAGCATPDAPVGGDEAALTNRSTTATAESARVGTIHAYDCAHNVTNVDNAIIANPKVINIYWGDYFTDSEEGKSDAAAHDQMWSDLSNNWPFWLRLSEYGVGIGVYGGGFKLNPSINSTMAPLSEDKIQYDLAPEIVGGALPNDENAIYVVYLPRGLRSQWNVNGGSTGHHTSLTTPWGARYAYAVIDGGDGIAYEPLSAHEVAEAATDAVLGHGWNEVGNSKGEIADLCNGTTVIAGHVVSQVWSQQKCACINF